MNVYRNINDFKPPANPVVTTGTFDGVHAGHQQIIKRLNEAARSINGESVVLTFHPHPRLVLYPDQHDLQLLTTPDEKIALLERYGVKHLFIHPFTKEFSQLSSAEFVKEILVKGLHVRQLIIGYDHHFGHDREGGLKQLQQLAPLQGFELEEIPEQVINAFAVSSTRIRKELQNGNIPEANILLGHDYSISGTVVKGKQLGRTLGFPTANIEVNEPHKLIPPNGIYAVQVAMGNAAATLSGKRITIYNGALSIGTRPTFDNGARSIEVNIFDVDDNLYDQSLTIFFKHYLRKELKFESAEALIEQMNQDKKRSIELLS